jgi:uncharacterized membrane-anchored protein
MPARLIVWLILITIAAAGVTILLAQNLGLPLALLGLVFAGAALAVRIWMGRK